MHSDTVAEVLSKSVRDRLNAPLGTARGLPSKAYTSDAVFELETQRLFRGGWLSVAFSHEVAEAGDVLPLTVAGVEMLVVRDGQGAVRAFHNVCRHRASTIVQEPCKGLTALRCPYHSWTYELNGRFRGAPTWDGAKHATLDPDENALAPIRCGEWQDLIFVNLAGDAVALESFVAPLEDRWSKFDLAVMQPYAHAERVIDANWKVVMEGLLEVYHENFLHGSLGYRIDKQGKPTWTDIMDGDVMGFVGALPDGDDDEGEAPLPRVPGMPATGPAPSEIFLLFPTTSINVMDNHVVRTIWTPVSTTQTRWRSTWYFAPQVFASDTMRKACDEIVKFWHVVRDEDLAAVLAVQKGHASWDSSPKEIQFSPFWEEIVRNFQRHVAERLA